jgi:hypothetical protein
VKALDTTLDAWVFKGRNLHAVREVVANLGHDEKIAINVFVQQAHEIRQSNLVGKTSYGSACTKQFLENLSIVSHRSRDEVSQPILNNCSANDRNSAV